MQEDSTYRYYTVKYPAGSGGGDGFTFPARENKRTGGLEFLNPAKGAWVKSITDTSDVLR